MKRKLISFLVAMLICATFLPSFSALGVNAEEVAESAPASAGSDEATDIAPTGSAAVEEPDWYALTEQFISDYNISPDNIAIGYMNLVTGDTYFHNADKYMVAASVYKLPLNMYFGEKVYNGEMTMETKIGPYRYDQMQRSSIVSSNNEISERLQKEIGSYTDYRTAIAPYCGVDVYSDPEFLTDNHFTPRQILNALSLLYDEPERYPYVLAYMKEANPDSLFRANQEEGLEIAHKYGFLSTDSILVLNDAGIIFTEEPFALVVFTKNNGRGDILSGYCKLMIEYTRNCTALRPAQEAAAAELAAMPPIEITQSEIITIESHESQATEDVQEITPDSDTAGTSGESVGYSSEDVSKKSSSDMTVPIMLGAVLILAGGLLLAFTLRKKNVAIAVFALCFVIFAVAMFSILRPSSESPAVSEVKQTDAGSESSYTDAVSSDTEEGASTGSVTNAGSDSDTGATADAKSDASYAEVSSSDSSKDAGTALGSDAASAKDSAAGTVEVVYAVKINASASESDLEVLYSYESLLTVDGTDCTCTEALIEFADSHPDCDVTWCVTLGKEQYSGDITELSLSGKSRIEKDEVLEKLKYFPNLQSVTLLGCGLRGVEQKEIVCAYPDISFLWEVPCGSSTVRSDATCYSTRNTTSKIARHNDAALADLFTYCTELVALDLTSNAITDLSPIVNLQKLQVLLIGDNPDLTDFSPLTELPNLTYLEIYEESSLTDFSFLLEMPQLECLNVSGNNAFSEPVQYLSALPKLQMLWAKNCALSGKECEAVSDTAPGLNFLYYYQGGGSTGGGWRATDRNVAIRKAFLNWEYVQSFVSWDNITYIEGSTLKKVNPTYDK